MGCLGVQGPPPFLRLPAPLPTGMCCGSPSNSSASGSPCGALSWPGAAPPSCSAQGLEAAGVKAALGQLTTFKPPPGEQALRVHATSSGLHPAQRPGSGLSCLLRGKEEWWLWQIFRLSGCGLGIAVPEDHCLPPAPPPPPEEVACSL